MIMVLDIASLLTALAASWLWYQASGRSIRRLHRFEEIDNHDFNRLVVAFNRTQQLNARAAMMTAISALCVAARFATSMVIG
ncbi:MAG: hypothetical protein CTY31_08160 [Hyphomicrobium sp.]|nr:MAG: hypothetical protein CTY39_01340 [Hyphomicrobium sp.]PPC99857.1 MAG: hypothetical protein CTY31_08160 [Hyphomicrobium sp.]